MRLNMMKNPKLYLAGEQVPEVMASFKDNWKHLKHSMQRLLKLLSKLFRKKRVIKGKTYSCRFVL